MYKMCFLYSAYSISIDHFVVTVLDHLILNKQLPVGLGLSNISLFHATYLIVGGTCPSEYKLLGNGQAQELTKYRQCFIGAHSWLDMQIEKK